MIETNRCGRIARGQKLIFQQTDFLVDNPLVGDNALAGKHLLDGSSPLVMQFMTRRQRESHYYSVRTMQFPENQEPAYLRSIKRPSRGSIVVRRFADVTKTLLKKSGS